jgi:LEA14-like dessication related protein
MKQLSFFLLFIAVSTSAFGQLKDIQYLDVENFKIQQIENNKAAISLDIRLYNPNNYKLKLKDADIDVFINGNHIGKVQQAVDKYEVLKNDTCLVPVILDVDMQNILANALQIVLSSGMADVKLSGTVKAGRHGIFIPIPINYQGKQDIGAMIKLQ